MGFDIFGLKARSEKGKYFRNNIWFWHPLASYILEEIGVEIPAPERGYWHSNEGQMVSKQTAEKIATRLEELIASGECEKYEKEYQGGSYPFSVENVREFAEFCKDSGGFEIF